MPAKNSSWRDKLHTVNLSFEEEMQIAAWYAKNEPDPWTCIEELTDDLWSIRVTPPGSGDDFWASASCRDSKSEFEGHTFSVHYPDAAAAVALLYYVVTVKLKRGDHDLLEEMGTKDWMKTSS